MRGQKNFILKLEFQIFHLIMYIFSILHKVLVFI